MKFREVPLKLHSQYYSLQGGTAKLVPQIVQQRLGQQSGSGQVQVVGAGQPQVQVVQQLGTQGQVVHQVRAQYTFMWTFHR